MLFKLTELKKFLVSLKRQKVENVNIQSVNLKLNVNTTRQKRWRKYGKNDKVEVLRKEKIKIQSANASSANTSSTAQKEQVLYFTIVSPMIGTFYRSPGPGEEAFININDPVKTKQTVCIIEAMKLMNEIESEVDGHVVEILVEDGDIVDCGQALMRIKER